MHGPVGATGFAELARPVERIHDPDPACAKTLLAVETFLRENRVVGTLLSQQLHQQHVGGAVAFVTQALGIVEADLVAQCHQCPSRGHGREAGELVVRLDHELSSPTFITVLMPQL